MLFQVGPLSRCFTTSRAQLMRTGDCTSLRFSFAKIGVNERNRDLSPTTVGVVRGANLKEGSVALYDYLTF
jgi:hypothetical protein